MIRKLVPYSIKVKLQLVKRKMADKKSRYSFAKRTTSKKTYPHSISITQELKPNEAKEKNIKIAIQKINQVEINTNEVFSFWKTIGEPSKKKGFVESRSLVNGKISKSIGGGLCQVSGLIYFISLKSGLEIIERHNHSMDIYTEETRFTPLGSDATVAFGYKDVRVKNNFDFPVKFSIQIKGNKINIQLLSKEPLNAINVVFENSKFIDKEVKVTTKINNNETYVSKYQRIK